MKASIYDTATGEIVAVMEGQAEAITLNVGAGQAMIWEAFDPETTVVRNGKPRTRPPRPWPGAQWTANGWREPDGVAARGAALARAQQMAVEAINAARGQARASFITTIAGQEMVYLEKEREARDWFAARAAGGKAPYPADFPHIAAEVGITASDMDQVAQVYLNKAAIFRAVSALIEAQSLAAVGAVEKAATAEAATRIATGFPEDLADTMREALRKA